MTEIIVDRCQNNRQQMGLLGDSRYCDDVARVSIIVIACIGADTACCGVRRNAATPAHILCNESRHSIYTVTAATAGRSHVIMLDRD